MVSTKFVIVIVIIFIRKHIFLFLPILFLRFDLILRSSKKTDHNESKISHLIQKNSKNLTIYGPISDSGTLAMFAFKAGRCLVMRMLSFSCKR